MALTGLEIYKQLPKKNCGECGVPTCLAFAMNLAGGKASLDSCPYVSEEAKANLEAAAAPPIAKVIFGTSPKEVVMGDETELFRHDKRFYHETAVAIKVDDDLSLDDLEAKVKEINDLQFDRVGQHYEIQAIACHNKTKDPSSFRAAVEKIAALSELNLVLMSENEEALKAALEVAAVRRPLLYAATAANYEKVTALAKEKNCPLVVCANNLNELADLVEKVSALGQKEIVLDPGAGTTSGALADFTQIRRLAIKKRFRPFGYPLCALTSKEDPLEEVLQASLYITKYASLLILNTCKKEHILPLLTWRQNIYTDPQVPVRVEEKLNAVGRVTESSPVYVTTNFSLTYYSVEGEIENSKIPSYLLAVDTDGLSVLTAYADGKFTAEKIAQVMEKVDLKSKVNHQKIVIPGAVAVLKGKLEDLTGWEVIVGPREASGIPAFARSQFGS